MRYSKAHVIQSVRVTVGYGLMVGETPDRRSPSPPIYALNPCFYRDFFCLLFKVDTLVDTAANHRVSSLSLYSMLLQLE